MGEVYLARDTALGRSAAIKFLTAELAADPDRLKRFIQEAKAASALNHPNILTVYEIGETDGRWFIATELIDGKTLREIISADEKVPPESALRIIIQVAEALTDAHRAGIIHRDIKPENIMIRKDGYAKVVDFGLAKLTEPSASASESVASGEAATHAKFYTSPGMILGTVAYMSPEQALGAEVDFRTDIFSLGVVLYELLTGRHPFAGKTNSHVIVAIIEKDPPPMSEFNVTAEIEKITLRALAKKRKERYQSAAELTDDLKMLLKQIEFQAELERTAPPNATGEAATQIFRSTSTGHLDTPNTIAVMPFVNMSRDENGDYFSDGLAEELLNVLSKIRGLRVAARTSAFSFKGKSATIAEIGRALNVASVLEGSIRTAGNRVRIAVQLVKVADGYQLWSETYNRTMDDIFAVQDDIAGTVVEELRAMLVGEDFDADPGPRVMAEVAEAVKGRADDPEAQRLMLLGRHYLDRTTREDTAKAIEYFRQALDLDPGYALCWAELGRAYSIQAGRFWVPVNEGFDLSRDATKRALALESDLAEAHAQLGRILAAHDWDLTGAEASYKRALELAPGSSSVLDGAGVLAYKLGNLERAVKLSRRVLRQDPLSAAFWHNLGLACHAAGRLDESEQAFRRAIELVPQRFVSCALLALVMADQGRTDEALVQAEAEPEEFWREWALAIIDSLAGRKAESDERLRKIINEHADGSAFQVAEIYAMRGETDEAFQWLERALTDRDSGVTHTKVNPRLRPLHNDPRWPNLLKKIGFNAEA